MNNGTKKKSQQLGMDFGKASNKLRASVFFYLLEKLGDNYCYRCGGIISSQAELSIDHKLPWLDVSSDLFWDINNIAFSHRSCNSSASRTPNKIECPEGTSWCRECKQFLPVECFHKNREKSKGLQTYCTKCTRRKYRMVCSDGGTTSGCNPDTQVANAIGSNPLPCTKEEIL